MGDWTGHRWFGDNGVYNIPESILEQARELGYVSGYPLLDENTAWSKLITKWGTARDALEAIEHRAAGLTEEQRAKRLGRNLGLQLTMEMLATGVGTLHVGESLLARIEKQQKELDELRQAVFPLEKR